jgi:FMN-dependent NADH-azoreductase
MNILQIKSSIYSADGQSSRLGDALVGVLRDPATKLSVRDLAKQPMPHLDAERFGAFVTPPEKRNAAQRAAVEYSDALIAELREADVLVLGLPMYNFGVPSQLKAWFDQLARAGVTFKYTPTGPLGLMTGKKAYVIATRGGKYAGMATDSQTQYVRDFLAFLGIVDVEFIYAEGLAIDAATREQALAQAQAGIDRRAARIAPTTAELALAA